MSDYAHFGRQLEAALNCLEGAASLVQAHKIKALRTLQVRLEIKSLNHYASLHSLGEDLERIQRELHQLKVNGMPAWPDEADDT